MRSRQISCGDRFLKQNPTLPIVWVVERMVDAPGLPAHVRLVREDRPQDMCTVSLDALGDRRWFRRAHC